MTARSMMAISFTATAVLSLIPVMDASADSSRGQKLAAIKVQACLEEAAQHFDYSDAIRVVHWVESINQRNLIEAELQIRTDVYSKADNDVAREYETTCVTDTLGKVIRIRVGSPS